MLHLIYIIELVKYVKRSSILNVNMVRNVVIVKKNIIK
jgi:hypothetical protein